MTEEGGSAFTPPPTNSEQLIFDPQLLREMFLKLFSSFNLPNSGRGGEKKDVSSPSELINGVIY